MPPLNVVNCLRVLPSAERSQRSELLALSSGLTEARQKSASGYAEGLAHWRAREFSAAAAAFGRSADVDRPAAMFRDRAQQLADSPPGTDWDPVRTLQEK